MIDKKESTTSVLQESSLVLRLRFSAKIHSLAKPRIVGDYSNKTTSDTNKIKDNTKKHFLLLSILLQTPLTFAQQNNIDQPVSISMHSENEKKQQRHWNEKVENIIQTYSPRSNQQLYANDNLKLPIDQQNIDNKPITHCSQQWLDLEKKMMAKKQLPNFTDLIGGHLLTKPIRQVILFSLLLLYKAFQADSQ